MGTTHEEPPGVSMITVVALTTATANLPGSSFISRAASLLISDTTVCGPHCISTWAITPSAITLVTRPTNRLRADLATPDGSGGGAAACRWANSASVTPSTTFRPTSSFDAGRVPESIHRRTVSSLTPSNSAASRIRNCGMDGTLSPHQRTQQAIRCAPVDIDPMANHRRAPEHYCCGDARRTRAARGNGELTMMPGMPDLTQIVLKAQQMQAEMERAQASLAEAEVTGTAGSGLVSAVVNGGGDLLRIRIDPTVVDPTDVETLEDLVVAAVHDARRAAADLASDAMGSVAGGLDL